MKTVTLRMVALAAVLLPFTAMSGSRSSASYSVPTDTVDAGGGKTTSASYSNDGNLGGIGGVSTAAAPAQTAKHSYIGQLYEVASLSIAASPATVNEGATRQLTASAVMDDATTLVPSGPQVAWSVQSGPITSINASGLATAGLVYQNEAASARGTYLGRVGTLGLTVLNVGIDNFGAYAGDGIDDLWQVQNFGLNSPNAGANADPDGDGQNNFFEDTAGTIPIDALSLFRLRIDRVPGQPDRKAVVFSPRFPSRTYTVEFRLNLEAGGFANLAGATTTDLGAERTVTDLNATGFSKFYRVRISFP